MGFNRTSYYVNKKDSFIDIKRHTVNYRAKKINHKESPFQFEIKKESFRGMRKFLERIGLL